MLELMSSERGTALVRRLGTPLDELLDVSLVRVVLVVRLRLDVSLVRVVLVVRLRLGVRRVVVLEVSRF